MNNGRSILTASVALLLLFVWTPWVYAGSFDQLVAAAEKEGVLELHAPSTLTPKGVQALADAFNRKYGLHIKIQFNPSQHFGTDTNKIITRATAGVAPEWDVTVLHDTYHATLWLRKLHVPFDYAKLGVDPRIVHHGGGTVSFANQILLPAYNNKILPLGDLPKSWDDLLSPKWKGKLGAPLDWHFAARLAVGAWGEEKTMGFVRALVNQKPILSKPGELFSRLQLGEVLISTALPDSFIFRAKKKGAPIVHAEVEPVLSPTYYAAVLKGAAHPNTGHLFVAFLTTPEAQKLWEEYTGQSSALIPGTRTHRYVQGKKVLYLAEDQAAMVDRLALEYNRIVRSEK